MGLGKFISKFIPSPIMKFFQNPLVQLGVTLFLSWILRPKVPEVPDFGTNEFDDFERGILLNKQSNDANVPVIYGEVMVGSVVISAGIENEQVEV